MKKPHDMITGLDKFSIKSAVILLNYSSALFKLCNGEIQLLTVFLNRSLDTGIKT